MEDNFEGQVQEKSGGVKQTLIVYAIISVILAIMIAIFGFEHGMNIDRKHVKVTFWMRVIIVIVAPIGGIIGMSIGRLLRDWVRPSFIMTSGGMASLLKTKLFWALGPQAIGLGIGEFIMCFLVGKMFA